jgi:phenylalanyl-tRNA synthetase beta chain
VMFELGQPLHTFDFDKLGGNEIVVRRARAGEEIRTLDGAKRTLAWDMCVIADGAGGQRAESIAGVMGGAESEIGFATRNVLIEAAWWDPISIRRTSKALNLRSEASMRFERGADIEIADLASRRAAELIVQVAGGEVLQGVVDVYPAKWEGAEIELSSAEIVRVMGMTVPEGEIERTLKALGFTPKRVAGVAGGAAWKCKQPSWRLDVTREIDLVEEAARIYGYDKFPGKLPAAKLPAKREKFAEAEDLLRERLVGLGYQEIVTIPLVGRERDELFRARSGGPGAADGAATKPAVILNPLSEEADVMRGSGSVGMATALEWNLNHGQHNLRLFEIGTAYSLEASQPKEERVLTLGATGLAREKNVAENAREFKFEDLKGDLERIGEIAGGWQWKNGGAAWLAASDRAEICGYGVAGKIGRKAAESFKLRQDVYVAELTVGPLLEAIERAGRARKFEPLPRFPAVERDFSLLLPEGTRFSQLVDAIRGLGIAEVRNIEAVDLYRGKNVPAGRYSLLVRVTLQSSETTFTDAQVSDFSGRIVGALEKQVGATLRAK